jgi:diguanylate cyclase (GGDEF)-like protein
MRAPLPNNEPARLQALREYQILDTPPERAFERITGLAARIFETPMAFVSLIDENRQFLKSCFGVDVRETTRDIAFCAHAIVQQEVMVVPNATLDARFSDNPLVTGEPAIRFYAGAPLKVGNGVNLGTLCIVDTQPRELSPGQVESLADLAAIVVDEMELRLASLQLRDEVRERQAAQERLAELAARDPLTGLHNRTVLDERLSEAITKAQAGTTAALLYLDLDSFKIVNDTLGHGAGDRLLVRIADLLREATRSGDTIARFGGDEFVLILASVQREQALAIAERIRALMEEFVYHESGKSFNVGASIGVALIDAKSEREQLLANADAACYGAKARGRNRVEIFEENREEIQRLREETDLAALVTEALREQRLELWLQPVVNIASGATEFHEALLRLRGADGSIMLPGSFFPAVVRFGLSEEVDRYVIRQAIKLLDADPALRLFVNLSAKAFNNPELLHETREAFVAAGTAAQRVTFEITETEVIRNLQLARELIDQLRTDGFRFALDDFGSGISNLAYLKTLPLDYLKIDGAYVKDIHVDKTFHGFVRAIAEIAAYLRVQTIAECVQSAEALDALRALGIHYGQGYFFGEPAPPQVQGLGKAQ